MSVNKRKFCHFFVLAFKVSDPNPESKSDPEGSERLEVLIIPDPQDYGNEFANWARLHTERAIHCLIKGHYHRLNMELNLQSLFWRLCTALRIV
jgi:hypothetical protein